MPQFVNTGDQRRTFPGLQNPDGSGVELDPGETWDGTLPVVDGHVVTVPYLAPADPPSSDPPPSTSADYGDTGK